MIEMGGQVYPAPLDQIQEVLPGVFLLWHRIATLAPSPVMQARFSDLLWEARFSDRPHEFAVQAIDSYIAAAEDDFGELLEKSDGVQRAMELAAQLNDPHRRSAGVESAVKLVRQELESEDQAPGVSLRLIEALASLRSIWRPSDLASLLDAAAAKYGSDAWHRESIIEIRARLADPSERQGLWNDAVDGFAALAEQSIGLVKYAHLQHAIELAEQNGLSDRADQLRRQVEHIPHEELGLKAISTEVEVPREKIDRFIDSIVGDDDLPSALTRFGAYVPTGLPEENSEFVRQLMAEHPLQFLFTRMTIGPENSLLRATTNEGCKEEAALLDHEAMRCSIFAVLAVEILSRVAARYGPLSGAREWLETPLIEPAVASRITRAFELYDAGDPDSAAALLAPRLERIIRRLALLIGLTVTRSPDARGRPGGVRALGDLLSRLQGSVPESTRRYLRVLLSEVGELNLRNRIGHGLVDEVASHEAALLIHACCHLHLLQETTEDQDDQ
jgi:hypothetical protein